MLRERTRATEGERGERQQRYLTGYFAEWIAAALLMAKGYRILALREVTSVGEIDIIALRGQRLVFVEVKYRASLEDAGFSVTARQRRRVRHAALNWIGRRPRWQAFELGFDLVLLAPWRWPRHIVNGL